jgi:hypothetical protein
MPSAGFETAIPATKLQQTYALDRATTRIRINELTELVHPDESLLGYSVM